MTRLMYDSTNIADDPAGADMVAYYIDGAYAVSAASVQAKFPKAVLVAISAIGTDAGIVGDCEPGCLTPAMAIEWVKLRREANADPSVYVNETYGWGPLQAAFKAANIPEPHWWVADYDGVASIPPGAVAKQYENPTLDHGHFDLSVAADYWPGVDKMDANDPNFQALIWRVYTLLYNLDTVPNGPTKGEKNELKVALDGLKAQIAAIPGDGQPEPKTVSGTFTGTLA